MRFGTDNTMNSFNLNILFEDNALIICEKPVGVLSEPDEKGNPDIVTMVSEYLSAATGKPAKVFLVHRLDRGVGGLMVLSKKEAMTAKLSQLIQNHNFTKEYLAVVHNVPEESEAVLKDLLFKDSSKNKSFVVTRPRKGTKEASLEYRLLETAEYNGSPVSLLRIKLHTGRTHQIRVQFSSRRMPLIGDGKYGSKDNHCEIALFSHRLCFEHPFTHKTVDVSLLPKKDVCPWNLFSEITQPSLTPSTNPCGSQA